MLAGVVWCLPGITINTAISDLAAHMACFNLLFILQQQMVSGTARLMFATLILFEIGFGFALGITFSNIFPFLDSSSNEILSSSVVVDLPTYPVRCFV